ncbi:MAG: hypothetical protein KGM96_10160 [Acidobacteriota bacterium]|nr:hypothetical protein [Acidobacteriota bacterium]
MVIESILAQLDAEIAKLTQARALLAGTGKVAAKLTAHNAKTATAKPHRKHVLSAEARKRIADAQRRRWAAQRAKAKKEA